MTTGIRKKIQGIFIRLICIYYILLFFCEQCFSYMAVTRDIKHINQDNLYIQKYILKKESPSSYYFK